MHNGKLLAFAHFVELSLAFFHPYCLYLPLLGFESCMVLLEADNIVPLYHNTRVCAAARSSSPGECVFLFVKLCETGQFALTIKGTGSTHKRG